MLAVYIELEGRVAVPRNAYSVAVLLLGGAVGLLSLIALGSTVLDALSTQQVYFPRHMRGGPPARMVSWTDALVYMLGLAAWSLGGMAALAAVARREFFARAAAASFATGAALLLVSWWHPGVVLGVGLLSMSLTNWFVFGRRRWLSITLSIIGVACLVYVAAL
jgi:hypothetical protein